jgi:hypothetical protein
MILYSFLCTWNNLDRRTLDGMLFLGDKRNMPKNTTVCFITLLRNKYSRINATKSPAAGAGNVSELRLMSEVGRLREVV